MTKNGGQSFYLQARITKLWRFKAQKVKNFTKKIVQQSLSLHGLWQAIIFGCGKEWYHFQ